MISSDVEKNIVTAFYQELDKLSGNEELILKWETGKVLCKFITCFDDFDDENEDDEFTSFVFRCDNLEGQPPIEFGDDNEFVINYHNFPIEITIDGKLISKSKSKKGKVLQPVN